MDEIICIVCSETFNSNERVLFLHCGHVYHDGCINRWMQQ